MDVPVRTSPNLAFRPGPRNEFLQNLQKKNSEEIPKQPNFSGTNNSNSEGWTSKIFDRIISVSLAAIFFGIPIFFTGLTAQGISFEKQLYFYFWILVALIAWTSNSVIKGEMNIRQTPLDIPIVIFWLAYLISTVFSVDKWHSFWGFFGDPTHGFVNVTASIVVYYLILSHFNMRRLRLMLGALITSGVVVIIWEILIVRGLLKLLDQNFVNTHTWAQYLPISLLGSISGASVFLSVLIVVLITAFLKTKTGSIGKTKKVIWMSVFLAIIALALYVLLAFYFFVPWPAVLIGVGFFLIYMLARIVNAGEGSTWLPMGVFMVILAILLVGNVVATSPSVISVQLPPEVSPQYQLSWQVAKEAIKHNFFIGSGPATYGYDFALYRPQDFNLNNLYNLQFYQGAGIFWEALPTLGALGTFALALLIISFFSVAVYLLSRDRDKGRSKIYSLGILTAMLIILVSSLIIRMDGAMIILGVLLGTLALGAILLESEAKEEYLSLSLKASPKYALALAFVFLVVSAGVVFLFVFLGRVYAADVFAGMANRQQNITEENSIGRVMKAINLYNKEGRYYTLGGQEYMALANSEFLKGANADSNIIGQYLDNSITLASKGRDLMPKDISAVTSLAQAYENKATYLTQFSDQAIASYNEALALQPNSPDIYLKLGQLKAKQASVEKDETKRKALLAEAMDMFQKSIDAKKNFSSGYYYLSLMQDQAGDLDKAIESAKNAVALNTKDVNGLFNLAGLLQKKGGNDNIAAAEYLYQQILQTAPNDVNTHLSLGLLYEKENKKDQAIAQYQTVLDVLPKDSDKARTQVQTFIDNVKKGISNEPKAATAAANTSSVPVSTPETVPDTTTTTPESAVPQQ
jgi:tetratricopeptide (TPR) repeat protein